MENKMGKIANFANICMIAEGTRVNAGSKKQEHRRSFDFVWPKNDQTTGSFTVRLLNKLR